MLKKKKKLTFIKCLLYIYIPDIFAYMMSLNPPNHPKGSLVAQLAKNPPATRETWV